MICEGNIRIAALIIIIEKEEYCKNKLFVK